MTIDRRDFLRWASYTGLSCVGSSLLPGLGKAQTSAEYDGPLWVLLHAGGGWDPTSLCDPKGNVNGMNNYATGDIRTAGNINYAPVDGMDDFFTRHFSRLLVLNGVDTTTNGHDQGVRGVWSGRTAEGYPSIGALVAATMGPTLPMAFVASGGYEETQGIARAVRLGDSAEVLRRLAQPAVIDPLEGSETFYGATAVSERIRQAREARLQRNLTLANLPKRAESMSKLQLAVQGTGNLSRVSEYLPAEPNPNGSFAQVETAMAAFQAGVATSVTIGRGGFDTHSNHDANHLPRLAEFTQLAAFVLDEADRRGISDKVFLVMGSDFGRTPGYNNGNGKDHWPITSMIVSGPGIPGNRVIGATDEGHRNMRIDPTTLAVVGDANSNLGVEFGVHHVHRALRQLIGVSPALSAEFPLGGEDLPLFA